MKNLIYTSVVLLFCCKIASSQSNYLDNYVNATVTLTTIGTSANQLNQPRDLDFKPHTSELWVCNYGNANGGTMIIFYNAGLPNQTSEYRYDDHSDHFFYYPSAIAFSDIGQWGAVSEIQNTNSSSPTFMGPSLWLGDTNIYARIFQNNWASGYPLGSHIDMLHQSPFAMGIAHDTALAYWVMDGYNGNICKYDFVNDHGPGYDDHSAGKIWRYQDVTVTRVPQVPSHLVLDKVNGWLYYIDGGNKKVKRMDVNSGILSGTLTPPSTGSESLAGYWRMLGATVELVDSFGTQPCGIDYYNNRLIVSDFTTGDIYLYSTDSIITLLDTIVTGHPGIMGIKVGPDGHIWCVNKSENKLYRLDAGLTLLDASITAITSPSTENTFGDFYSTGFNVCTGDITPVIDVMNSGSDSITEMEIHYSLDGGPHTVYNWNGVLLSNASTTIALPTGPISNGNHQLDVMIMMVNGMDDDVDLNNTMTGAIRAISPNQTIPFTEDFASNVFPPANWNYVYFNKNNYMNRSSVSSFGVGAGSMKMNNYSGPMNITGQEDHLISPIIDFTTANTNTYLTFDVAYAKYSSGDLDALKVSASTDCGQSWNDLYNKSGTALSTAPQTTSAFTPTSAQWRIDSVNLAVLTGESEVMIMFTTVSNFGNNVYLDNIRVDNLNVGISDIPNNSVKVYPNPVQSALFIEMKSNTFSNVKVQITDIAGRILNSSYHNFDNNPVEINTEEYKEGIYFISIDDGGLKSVVGFMKSY